MTKVSEWTPKAPPYLFLVLITLYAALIVGLSGCGDDDDANEWVGTWIVETVDGQSAEQFAAEELGIDLANFTFNWTFHDDGTWKGEMGLGGIRVAMTGTYSLSDFNYEITATENPFFSDLSEDLSATGTWSIKGNTLTLTADDGTVTVLKKE